MLMQSGAPGVVCKGVFSICDSAVLTLIGFISPIVRTEENQDRNERSRQLLHRSAKLD